MSNENPKVNGVDRSALEKLAEMDAGEEAPVVNNDRLDASVVDDDNLDRDSQSAGSNAAPQADDTEGGRQESAEEKAARLERENENLRKQLQEKDDKIAGLEDRIKVFEETLQDFQERFANLEAELQAARTGDTNAQVTALQQRIDELEERLWRVRTGTVSTETAAEPDGGDEEAGGGLGWGRRLGERAKSAFKKGWKFLFGKKGEDSDDAYLNSLGENEKELLLERRKRRGLFGKESDVSSLEKLLESKVIYWQDLTRNERHFLERESLKPGSKNIADLRKTSELPWDEYRKLEKEREKRYIDGLPRAKKICYLLMRGLVERWLPVKVGRNEKGEPDGAHGLQLKHKKEEGLKGAAKYYVPWLITALGGVAYPVYAGATRLGTAITAGGLSALGAGARKLGERFEGRAEEELSRAEKRYQKAAWRVAAVASWTAQSEVLRGASEGLAAAAVANLAGAIWEAHKSAAVKPAEGRQETISRDEQAAKYRRGEQTGGTQTQPYEQGEGITGRPGISKQGPVSRESVSGEGVQRVVEAVPKVEIPGIDLGKEIEIKERGDGIWAAFRKYFQEQKGFGENWVNPVNNVHKEGVAVDYVVDMLRAHGINLSPGSKIILERDLPPDVLRMLGDKIINPKTLEEYMKNAGVVKDALGAAKEAA